MFWLSPSVWKLTQSEDKLFYALLTVQRENVYLNWLLPCQIETKLNLLKLYSRFQKTTCTKFLYCFFVLFQRDLFYMKLYSNFMWIIIARWNRPVYKIVIGAKLFQGFISSKCMFAKIVKLLCTMFYVLFTCQIADSSEIVLKWNFCFTLKLSSQESTSSAMLSL